MMNLLFVYLSPYVKADILLSMELVKGSGGGRIVLLPGARGFGSLPGGGGR